MNMTPSLTTDTAPANTELGSAVKTEAPAAASPATTAAPSPARRTRTARATPSQKTSSAAKKPQPVAKKDQRKAPTKAAPKSAIPTTGKVAGKALATPTKPAAAAKKGKATALPKATTAATAPASAKPAQTKGLTNKAASPQTAQVKAANKKKLAPAVKPAKDKKIKVVRDSFTLPKAELVQIDAMKKRAMALGVEVKKSELIRAGLQALAGMADTAFKKAMAQVPTIKTGRPAKD